MLKDAEVMATVAVRSVEKARAFYEGKLGLELASPPEPGMIAYRSGGTTLLVYESQFAGTNLANAATFSVKKDIESLVAALQGKGVKFEQYDLPETVRDGVIHRGHGRSVAWCKDPDCNILCLVQE